MSAHPLAELLSLRHAPVALAFRSEAPAGVPRVEAGAPSGCAYWRMAQEGRVFYTEPSDHYGCPVGAHTHGVPMPPETAKELEGLIGVMVGLEYLSMEEIPSIPTLGTPFGVAVYAPLEAAPCEPDVVLVRGNARQIMLLSEAARSAGVDTHQAPMGRPACAAVPAAIQGERPAVSLGCIGNRVYTGLADDEFYFAIPGRSVEAITDRLRTILHANRELEAFHRGRAGDAA